MGWLKNWAIKSTAKRIFNEFWNQLSAYSTANPNHSITDALHYILSTTYNISDKVVDEVLTPNSGKFESMLQYVVWEQVYKKFSHDPTIGTQEDIFLVFNVVNNCWQKLTEGTDYLQNGPRIEKEQDGEDSLSVIRKIYNSLSPKEKVNLKQEFIRTVLKNDPSLYKRYKNDNKISELFYDEFLRDKLGE